MTEAGYLPGITTGLVPCAPARGNWTARLDGYEAMTILADETVFKTGGFPDE